MYLNSNFFLFSMFDQTNKGENARRIARKIIEGEKAITSASALNEVMWIILKNKRREALRSTVESIYAMQNLSIKEVSESTPLDALALMEQFDLKPRDAFYTAVMKSNGIFEIVSDDPDSESQ